MSHLDVNGLVRAASDRQAAVAALQKKYQESNDFSTEQLVGDMGELLATERIVLDAIITLFVELGNRSEAQSAAAMPPATPSGTSQPPPAAPDVVVATP